MNKPFLEYTHYFSKDINIFLRDYIPQHIRLNYPNFVEFIRVYYEYICQAPQSFEFISNMLAYGNVDETTLDYLDNFSDQFLKDLKFDQNIDEQILIKYIKEYYESAGSEKSFKFLFRILYNEDVNFYYPSYDILRVSDGKWQIDNVIKITNSAENSDLEALEGSEIIGATSGARGLVERVSIKVTSHGDYVAEIFLTDFDPLNPIENFFPGEWISGTSLDGETNFDEQILYLLTEIDMSVPGEHYRTGDIVHIGHPTGYDAFIIVNQTSKGTVSGAEIINPGTGYYVNQIIEFNNKIGSGIRGIITEVDALPGMSGPILSIDVERNTFPFNEMPYVDIKPIIIGGVEFTGQDAIIFPITQNIGEIESCKIINFGLDYVPDQISGGPDLFPIEFPIDLMNADLEVCAVAYVWNDSSPQSLFVNEIVTGSVSNSTGLITRYNEETGMIGLRLLTGNGFIESDVLTGLDSGSTGNEIHIIWQADGIGLGNSVGTYNGYFRNTDGHISSDKYIQDSYYYQDFSYVLTTLRKRAEWIDIVKDKIHPAGSIVFSFGDGKQIIADPSWGGWMSPILDLVELDKFKWAHQPRPLSGSTIEDKHNISDIANSTIERYMPYRLWDVIWIDPERYPLLETIKEQPRNYFDKTLFAHGSTIEVI